MSRRSLLIAVAVAVCAGMAGCAASPDFSPPIRWSSGWWVDVSDGQRSPDSLRLVLAEDGHADVEDFPIGFISANGCLPLPTDESPEAVSRYSGPAQWRTIDAHTIEVEFEGSQMQVIASRDILGSQDWTEVNIVVCGAQHRWTMSYECGWAFDPREGGDGAFQKECD